MTALHLFPELEDSLRRVPGVRKARVVTDGEGRPTEIHVITDTRKPPKDFVRDVQAVALTHYDLALDHRIVSVVQIEDDTTTGSARTGGDEMTGFEAAFAQGEHGPTAAPEPSRPAIIAISVRTSGPEAEAEVQLEFGPDTFRGAITGPAAAQHRPRLVAQATLAALGALLGVPAEVDSATIVDVGGSLVALVVVTVTVPRLGAQSVSGSAVLRGDDADAVCRAVLDALNRRLTG